MIDAAQLSAFTAESVSEGLPSFRMAPSLSPFDAGGMLGELAMRFRKRRAMYWKGEFDLAEEIAAASWSCGSTTRSTSSTVGTRGMQYY